MINHLIKEIVNHHLGADTEVLETESVSGGCINNALKINTNQGSYFIKYNQKNFGMFEKEAYGIALLSKCKELKLPKIYAHGIIDSVGYLFLEFVEKGRETEGYWSSFGKGLASLHLNNSNNHFGLKSDNYIGSLEQTNSFNEDWITFFITQRLLPQIKLGTDAGIIDKKVTNQFESLFKTLPNLFPLEKPALLHGDLWSGNVMATKDELPCIFDPAIYYGNREVELAFSKLFGGFHEKFYESYNYHYPLQNGFEERIDLHNLYPLLVHANLFGISYISGIQNTLNKFT